MAANIRPGSIPSGYLVPTPTSWGVSWPGANRFCPPESSYNPYMANVGGSPPYNFASGHHPFMGSSVPKLGNNFNPRAKRPPFVTNTVSVATAAEFSS